MDILYMLSKVDAICRAKNIKKATLYDKVGITSAAVSQWRTGKTTPSKSSIESIAEFLGVTVSELTGEQKEKPTHDVDELSELKKHAHRLIDGISEEELEQLMPAIERLLGK